MARRVLKQKMLTALPTRFRPDFIDRMNRNYVLARVVLERREALRAHVGGDPSYVQERLITRTLWLELLVEQYEQKIADGLEVDVGALTQLGNTLKGLYKDLGLTRRAKPATGLQDYLAGRAKSRDGASQ
jgi:hypothetical protein